MWGVGVRGQGSLGNWFTLSKCSAVIPVLFLSPLPLPDVPSQVRLPALQAVMLLLPDEHREVLQTLLLFLKDVANYSEINQVGRMCNQS